MDDGKMIFRWFRYFYYRVYIWQMRLYGHQNAPDGAALSAVLGFMIFNILTFFEIMEIFTGIDFIGNYSKLPNEYHIAKNDQIICTLIIFLVIYKIICRASIPKKVVNEFKYETKRQNLIGTVLIWSYIIGSIVAMIILAFLVGVARDSNLTVCEYVKSFI